MKEWREVFGTEAEQPEEFDTNSVTDNGISETQYQESNERGCRRKENHRMAARGA